MRLIFEKLNKTVYIYKEYFVLLLCIVLSVLLLFSNQNTQVISLKIVVRELTGKVQHQFMWIPNIFSAVEQNKILRKKNVSLLLENSTLKEALIENQRLRELLEFKKREKNSFIAADVIGRSIIDPTNTVMLNVGSEDGIKKNDPVINEKGLVGKIIEEGPHVSLCQLLTDRNFTVSAKVQENRAYGLLMWKHDNYAELKISVSSEVKKGYHVITSGYSTIYPAGIPIGRVVKFEKDDYGLFNILKIKLNNDFYTIENVFIVSVPEKPPIASR